MIPDREDIEKLVAESKAQQEEAAALGRIHLWDKAMRRAFKGIFPRPASHRALQRSVKKHNLLEEDNS